MDTQGSLFAQGNVSIPLATISDSLLPDILLESETSNESLLDSIPPPRYRFTFSIS